MVCPGTLGGTRGTGHHRRVTAAAAVASRPGGVPPSKVARSAVGGRPRPGPVAKPSRRAQQVIGSFVAGMQPEHVDALNNS